MKKIIIAGFVLSSFSAFSQEKSIPETDNSDDFNRWSLEFNAGVNKPIKPYTEGYYSSDPKKYFNFSTVSHFDFGTRYMFSDVFGAKLDFGYDKIQDQKGSGSLDFEATKYSIGLQGVVDLGSVMNFRSFTKRLSLLAHAGIQVSQFTSEKGRYDGITEDNGAIIFGFTPQLRITERIALTGDFSVVNNVRQHYNWDGMQLSDGSNNLSGVLYTTSVGLTVYLGKNDHHSDWHDKANASGLKSNTDDEARAKIAELEKMLNDVDRDGVPDYLDAQNNTPSGVAVDTRGRFIDVNRNGVPDELEGNYKDGRDGNSPDAGAYASGQSDAMKSLIKNRYLNIFFDVNQDFPNTGSTGNVFQIIQFMKANPEAKVKLYGYADIRGGEKTNKDLSDRRAHNIFKILVSSGINKDRITFTAEGVDKTFSGDTKTSLDLARRVSVILE